MINSSKSGAAKQIAEALNVPVIDIKTTPQTIDEAAWEFINTIIDREAATKRPYPRAVLAHEEIKEMRKQLNRSFGKIESTMAIRKAWEIYDLVSPQEI